MFVISITLGVYVGVSSKDEETDLQQDLKSPGIINETELIAEGDTVMFGGYVQGGVARPMVGVK